MNIWKQRARERKAHHLANAVQDGSPQRTPSALGDDIALVVSRNGKFGIDGLNDMYCERSGQNKASAATWRAVAALLRARGLMADVEDGVDDAVSSSGPY